MRYFCTDCAYIYDEAFWEEELGFWSWVKMENISDFYCPSCESGGEAFQPIIEEVLYAENNEHLSTIEKEHIPHILYIDYKEGRNLYRGRISFYGAGT